MHEFRLIKDLMNDIVSRGEREGAKKVTSVKVRMGEYTEIDPEILRFYFSENSKDTIIDGAEIIIEQSPTRELRLLDFDIE